MLPGRVSAVVRATSRHVCVVAGCVPGALKPPDQEDDQVLRAPPVDEEDEEVGAEDEAPEDEAPGDEAPEDEAGPAPQLPQLPPAPEPKAPKPPAPKPPEPKAPDPKPLLLLLLLPTSVSQQLLLPALLPLTLPAAPRGSKPLRL